MGSTTRLLTLLALGLSAACTGQVPCPNQQPVANAGQDLQVRPGLAADLDGSGSHDPDGDTLTWHWQVVAAPDGDGWSLPEDRREKVDLVTDRAGVWLVRLQVHDGSLWSQPDVVLVEATERFCTQAVDCEDDNPCTHDRCPEGTCVYEPAGEGSTCDDGLYCSQGESCQAGNCTGGSVRDCGDGDSCTLDSCDEAGGVCSHVRQLVPGAEGPWDHPDTCADSLDNDCDGLTDHADSDCQQCLEDIDCDDGDACTVNTCDADSHCLTSPAADGSECDDGLVCSDSDSCTSGACGGTPRDCTGLSDECKQGVCNQSTGACMTQAANEGGPCDDGDDCSSFDTCQAGTCLAGPTDRDGDADGYLDGRCPGGDDCDDANENVNPGIDESTAFPSRCQDEIDNDCDGLIDAEDPYRKLIYIDGSRVGGTGSVHRHFPVLVALVDTDLRDHVGDPFGHDINFRTATGAERLDHEVELFTVATGALVAWVRIPGLAQDDDTAFYLYYGDRCTDSPSSDPALVWDASSQGIWHLGEKVNDEQTDGAHRDSSGQMHAGSQFNNDQGPGKIGYGQVFDGDDDYINIANSGAIQLGDADCTVSAWIKTASVRDMGIVVKSLVDAHEPNDKLLGVNHTPGKLGIDQGWVTYLAGTSDIVGNGWHYVVWTQEQNVSGEDEEWSLYINGRHESSLLAATTADPPDHTIRIGGRCPGSYFSAHFDGSIDELRISDTLRSPGWILTSFNNQNWPNKATWPTEGFLSVGAEETGD